MAWKRFLLAICEGNPPERRIHLWGEIHLSPVDSPHKRPEFRTLMLSLLSARTSSWTTSRVTNDLRCHDAHVTSLLWSGTIAELSTLSGLLALHHNFYLLHTHLYSNEPSYAIPTKHWLDSGGCRGLLAMGIENVILDPFYWHGLTLIPAWINIYIHYEMWDEIINPFPNSSVAAVKVYESTSNFMSYFTGHMITYFLMMLIKFADLSQSNCSN